MSPLCWGFALTLRVGPIIEYRSCTFPHLLRYKWLWHSNTSLPLPPVSPKYGIFILALKYSKPRKKDRLGAVKWQFTHRWVYLAWHQITLAHPLMKPHDQLREGWSGVKSALHSGVTSGNCWAVSWWGIYFVPVNTLHLWVNCHFTELRQSFLLGFEYFSATMKTLYLGTLKETKVRCWYARATYTPKRVGESAARPILFCCSFQYFLIQKVMPIGGKDNKSYLCNH